MESVAQRLAQVEERLARLLTSGWRSAGAEVRELAAAADPLTDLGLPELAARLRRLAAAQDAREAMGAAAMALAASRLLRARLPASAVPPGRWLPLSPPTGGRGKEPRPVKLYPLSRLQLDQGEAWSCIHRQGGGAELLLVRPLRLGPSPRLLPRGNAPAGPWLHRPLTGHLQWQARYPLGAAAELTLCTVTNPQWEPPPNPAEDGLASLRATLASGHLQDGAPVLPSGSRLLRLRQVDAAALTTFAWPSPDVRSALATALDATHPATQDPARQAAGWALTWERGGVVMPLALLRPGGPERRPKLVHLVPGLPAEPLP